MPKQTCEYARLDVKLGRTELLKHAKDGKRVPFIIHGYIQVGEQPHSRDDGDSIEFGADVVRAEFLKPEKPKADKFGRPYAKLNDLQPGDRIDLDDGFTCMEKKKRKNTLVRGDANGLFFWCKDGRHYLDGQADDGVFCVGVYHACR